MPQQRRPKIRLRPAKSQLNAPRLTALERRIPRRRRSLAGFKNPLLARAGGQSIGGSIPGGRITRGIAPIVFLGLIFLGSRFFLGQKLGISGQIERVARNEYIPLLEKQLGAKVEVGEFSTDWLGRVQVDNIVVGRDAKLPTGALIQAKRATVSLDLIGLALRRKTAIDAISRVDLDSPQVYVERDAQGNINLQKLIKSGKKGPTPVINATLYVSNGRVYYLDRAYRSGSGQPILADARQINAKVVASSIAPYRFSGAVGSTLIGRTQYDAKNIGFSGALELEKPSGLLRVSTPFLPAPLLGDYAFRKREATITNGAVKAEVQLALSGKTLIPRGTIEVQNVAAVASKLREPRAGKQNAGENWRVADADGILQFTNTALKTDNFTFRALDSYWRAAGMVSAGKEIAFDMRVRTDQVPLRRLLTFADPRQVPVDVQARNVKLDTQVAGEIESLNIAGTLQAENTAVRLKNRDVNATTPTFRALFAVKTAPKVPVRFAMRAALPLATVRGSFPFKGRNESGSFTARQILVSSRGAANNSPVEVGLQATSWRLDTGRFGGTDGQNLRLVASEANVQSNDWHGSIATSNVDTNRLNLDAVSPDARKYLESSGRLNVSANFGDVNKPNPFVDADFELSSLSLNPGAIPANFRSQIPPTVARELLNLRRIRGQVALRNGEVEVRNAGVETAFGGVRGAFANGRFAVDLPLGNLASTQLNDLLRARGLDLQANWTGRVALASGSSANSYESQFSLQAPTATLKSGGTNRALLRDVALRGALQLDQNRTGRSDWKANATIIARELSLGAGRLGSTEITLPKEVAGTRLRDGKIVVSASSAGWNARVDASRIAVKNPLVGQPPLTLSEPFILANSSGDSIEISRARASWGSLGTVNGTATIRGRQITAKVLAREIEASALQNFVAASSRRDAKVSGKISALATLAPGKNPVLQFQMPEGRAEIVAQNMTVPVSAMRGEVEVTPTTLLLRRASLWSDGAKIEASAVYPLKPANSTAKSTQIPTAKLKLAGFRLNRIPLTPQLQDGARLDGLVSGEFDVSLGKTPEIKGRSTANGMTIAGTDISQAQGNVEVFKDPEGWRLALADWTGTVEDAPFKADLESDIAQNYWRLTLSTPNLAARRIALLQARATRKAASLPLEGDFLADIDVNGEFKARPGEKRPFWIPRAGYAILQAKNVRWRGRSAGALNTDFAFLGDVARINTFELNPPPEDTDPTDGETPSFGTPKIEVKGTLPFSGDSNKLSAQIDMGEAPLQFFRDAIKELNTGLQQIDINVPALQRAVTYSNALPEGTRGRIALQGEVKGSWDMPNVRVSSLTLRDGRAPLPTGGLSTPAKLDAAFSYQQGTLKIENSAFQIEKTDQEKADGEENTIVRVEEGGIGEDGTIDISADVFNANLSQLASWVPALRNNDTGEPLIRGTLTDFSVTAGGNIDNPEVTGSIQAENLAGQGYSLDRILVSRFEIKDGFASINPGNLTISKGRFTSRSAFAKVPLDLKGRGLIRNEPIQAGINLQTRDFIALAGVFVPSLKEISAKEISGELGVAGTLDNPQLTGMLTLDEAAFQVQNSAAPFPVALSGLSGKMRFIEGNHLVIDADDPLRGKLAGASVVEAQAVKKGQSKTKAKTPEQDTTPNPRRPDYEANGAFNLHGDVKFDLSPETFALGARGFGRHKYDLAFSIADANVSSPLLAGFQNGDAAVLFKTQENGAPNLRWMLAARGAKAVGQKRGGGDLISIGNLNMRSDFAAGANQFLRSQAQEFDSTAGFENFSVFKRMQLTDFPDRRPQVLFKNLQWGYTGVGNGELVGRIVLDNRMATRRAPIEARQILNNQLRPPISQTLEEERANPWQISTLPQPWLRYRIGDDRRPVYRTGPRVETDLFGVESVGEESVGQIGDALRFGGDITLQNADIFGAPAGEGGTLTRLSSLPSAPRFDIALILGKQVNFVNSVFRTGLTGELVASGTPRDPQILGTVELREGMVRFPNARARIQEGTINVAITRDAETDLLRSRIEVDAEATGNSGIYQVSLKLRGPLDLNGGDTEADRLQVDVTSNPPLAQSEAFAQLLGIAPNSMRGNDDDFDSGRANQAYAQAVLQFVAAPFFDGFERSVAKALGLDSIGFEYRFNEPLAIQLSKALGDRVFVSYRRSLGPIGTSGSGDAPEELRVDYRIKGNYLIGVKINEQNVYGITLQRSWRF